MKTVTSLLGFLIIVAFTQLAYSDQQPVLLLTVQPVITPTLIKAPPVISGAVTDMNGIAVTNATVIVTISSKQTDVQTDGQGSFTVNLPSKLHVGEYVIEVQASKSLYSDAFSYVEYTVNPPLGNQATAPPLYYDNYTLYLGDVTSWNDNTGTCTIITVDSHKAINQACNPANMGFGSQISGKSDSLLSLMQYNGTYKIFPAGMYFSTIRLTPSLVPGYLNESWNS
jgi:hypothetical protein